MDKDWRFDSMLRAQGQQFEKHSQKLEELLSKAQDKFKKDYTGFSASIGFATILVSFLSMFFGKLFGNPFN